MMGIEVPQLDPSLRGCGLRADIAARSHLSLLQRCDMDLVFLRSHFNMFFLKGLKAPSTVIYELNAKKARQEKLRSKRHIKNMI